MNCEHLKNIREYELERIMDLVAPRDQLLEIGAGAGWQARIFAGRGVRVEAIDVENTIYESKGIWPVIKYDGVNIPFPDNHFDVIFSSNVLEHILYVEEFQNEIKRVLRPDGIVIHMLPTASWRLWTSITHYIYILKAMIIEAKIRLKLNRYQNSKPQTLFPRTIKKYHPLELFFKVVWPACHGEHGNSITEIFFFSRFRWISLFKRTGWQLKKCYPTRLFYTGYSVLNSFLSFEIRHLLSFILGSSCLIYVLKRSE